LRPARTFCQRYQPTVPISLLERHAGWARSEESANSEKFNCTPGAILPINEDDRLQAADAGSGRQVVERGLVPTRDDVRAGMSNRTAEVRK
jgi:hypothetical protein